LRVEAEIVVFRVRHDGPLARFTRDRPHLSLAAWCNWAYDAYELSGATPEEARELAATLGEAAEVHQGAATQLVVLRCSDVEHNVVSRICYQARCLHVPPARHKDGWEMTTMVAFGEQRARETFRELKREGHEVELLSKRPAAHHPLLQPGGPGVAAVFEGLTERQAEALLLAHRHGHYVSPRSTTAAAIAASLGLSRSTFEEHLRKAENHVIDRLVPYLELEVRSRPARAEPATPP
jgi:predicted DNA binding protein